MNVRGWPRELWNFAKGSVKLIVKGPPAYWAWLAFLLALLAAGIVAYLHQLNHGLITTAMRDPVSWGMYIGNFTFLVGVAAAAVVLVIPAYVYDWKPIKEIVILGEILAVSAIVMCVLFVTVDIGRPDRIWHILPLVGSMNFPISLLAWDVIVLSGYGLLNFFIVTYYLSKLYNKKPYNKKVLWPLVIVSIPMAVSIHTVTAFLYNGLAARPYWNASILAPRFLASAFCSGPAIMLILLQVLQRATSFEIKKEALWKIAELMAYAMFINLFLLGAELFKEYYSDTEHLLFHKYAFHGIGEHKAIVPFMWTALFFQITAFLLFLIPRTRKSVLGLNLGCLLIYGGVYIEKGMGLVIPGFTPSTLGEIYEYTPSFNEITVTAGVFAAGFLVFTLMCKVAVPILLGEFSKA
ncbi:MAG: polysulfide reductase [Deltaproteobacteria bacterium]|nr:MAG: polysulfide reductase [Deltaproteobacteria bacterium]